MASLIVQSNFNDTNHCQSLKRNLSMLLNDVQLSTINALEGVCLSAHRFGMSLTAGVGTEDRGVYVNYVATNRPHWLMFHNMPVCFCNLLVIYSSVLRNGTITDI
jgi:hypothetical protein